MVRTPRLPFNSDQSAHSCNVDECQPPDNANELEDKNGYGLNVNGAICLNFVCQWANVTAGQECEVENVGYITYGANNSEYVDIVSRYVVLLHPHSAESAY